MKYIKKIYSLYKKWSPTTKFLGFWLPIILFIISGLLLSGKFTSFNQSHSGVGDNIIGDKYVNEEAQFTLINRRIEIIDNGPRHKTTLNISASKGITPDKLCVTISTDAKITYVSSSFLFRRGDKQTKMCFNQPLTDTKSVITYYLDTKPSFFEVILNQN